ncbi:MAG: hypothetical protein L3J32_06070 [Rhizobiaceae bacterium]|nr:hypothetical protein [Rhizobiaceae bacterium]
MTNNSGSSYECLAFQPIYWSSNDTSNTKGQILEHNSVWDALCQPDLATQ